MELFIIDKSFIYVSIGIILLGCTSGIIGTFFTLERKSLVSDAVSHSMLPGVCLGFLFAREKNFLSLIAGAFFSGFVSLILINYISKRSKIKQETSTSIVLSSFFGFGVVLLSIIQNSNLPKKSGLQFFIFGKAASLMQIDIIQITILSIFVILFVVIFFKEFTIITFDKSFAKSIGYPINFLQFLISFLTIISITIGIQGVGVVLMSAMLITPITTARFWTNNLKKMIFLAALFGIFSGFSGSLISYFISALPTGPSVVVIMSIIALFSFLISPKKGIIYIFLKKRNYKIRIEKENILKYFYEFGLKRKNFKLYLSLDDLKKKFTLIKSSILIQRLKSLTRSNYLKYIEPGRWALTIDGKHMGSYILKLHCLWEGYLTQYLNINPSHVHEDAESMEHILTPELERELITLVGESSDSVLHDKNI